jgi:hypothetical protein
MQNPSKQLLFIVAFMSIALLSYQYTRRLRPAEPQYADRPHLRYQQYPPESWFYFLQHLPTQQGLVLDFTGKPVPDQGKHFSILTYDVGNTDLQQCADALMRLRSEYLFSQKKYEQIGFHFNSGIYYSYAAYLKGMRPVYSGKNLKMEQSARTSTISHSTMRLYLNIVFAYANTVSLCKELKPAKRLETGTVIIFPGHPGHCCMVVDAAITDQTDTVFKLAEGYMPAQSIYILSNPFEPEWNPWYHLGPGDINTASCSFRSYYLKKFE